MCGLESTERLMMSAGNDLETGKMGENFDQQKKLLAFCVFSNKRVITAEWQQVSIMNDEAIWWKCPACDDWHINLLRRNE